MQRCSGPIPNSQEIANFEQRFCLYMHIHSRTGLKLALRSIYNTYALNTHRTYTTHLYIRVCGPYTLRIYRSHSKRASKIGEHQPNLFLNFSGLDVYFLIFFMGGIFVWMFTNDADGPSITQRTRPPPPTIKWIANNFCDRGPYEMNIRGRISG